MTDANGNPSAETKSALSANANIFIPRSAPVSVAQGPGLNLGGGVAVQHAGAITPQGVQEIPAYMINCYPFVQEDGPRKPLRWPPNNTFRQTGPGTVRPFGRGKNFQNPIQPFSGNSSPYSAPCIGPVTRFPRSPIPPASPQQPFFPGQVYNQNHQWPAKVGQGQLTRPWLKEGQRSGNFQGRQLRSGSGEGDGPMECDRRNNLKPQSRRNQPKVVRIPDPETRPRTIILMDLAVQTDFSDTIANLTLKERPNGLYKNSPLSSKDGGKGILFSPSGDVDSDSGYSSPLHRRNMVSNGTQPLEATHCDINLFIAPDNSKSTQSVSKESKISYAAMAQKPPPPRIPVRQNSSNDNGKSNSQQQRGNAENRNVSKTEAGLSENEKSPRTTNNSKFEDTTNPEEKKKRKRVRKRRKKGDPSSEAVELTTQNVDHPSQENVNCDIPADNILHFEDEEEFPDLISANPSRGGNQDFPIPLHTTAASSIPQSQPWKTTSSCLAQSPPKTGRSVSFFPTPLLQDDSDQENAGKSETKTARKRRKRREKANKAAEDELAEISLEQHMLRELNLKRPPQNQTALRQPQTLAQRLMSSQPMTANKTAPVQEVTKEPIKEAKTKTGGKKFQQPMLFDIGALLESKKPEKNSAKKTSTAKATIPVAKGSAPNMLDSNAPVVKRGKERETPKAKKPSPLKKVILKEREERKRSRIIGEDTMISSDMGDVPRAAVGVGVITAESDLSQDGVDNSESESSRVPGVPIPKAQSADFGVAPATSDLSPVSQTSPISMTPLSSGLNSPIVGHVTREVTQAALKIHSRRFREYCHQVLDKEIDACCTNLLQDLVRFQDRSYHKDPTKAKAKRRLVLGLREVTKHLRLKKIKCVIISPNLEKIQSKGGLDEALNKIIELCNDQNVPFVFALGRRALGRACAKLVPVSVAGIFNYEGSEANFQELMDLTAVGRQAYKDMVSVLEREIIENPVKVSSHIYAHMGHSRTPSACSAISFTSSVLSEPISENYPQSEPEVDSKGNEIVKDENVDDSKAAGEKAAAGQSENVVGKDSKSDSVTKANSRSVGRFDEIDDGNEADTEDIDGSEMLPGATTAPPLSEKEKSEKFQPEEEIEEDYEDEEDFEDDFEDENDADAADVEAGGITHDSEGNDNVKELPHIESFHASSHDLSAEILSQHSARTGDTVEGASTHSSKTIGDGSLSHTADALRSEQHGVSNIQDSSKMADNNTQNKKIVDRERIKTWVEQSQSALNFHLEDVESTSESQIEADNSSTDDLLDVDAGLNKHTVDTYL